MKKITIHLLLLITLIIAGCTEENYYTTISPDDKDGKVNIYIEGNITNEEAQAQLEAELGTQTENIYVQETTGLTDITINLVGNIRDIYFDKNLDLKNVTINGNNSKANNITISEYTSNGLDPTDKKYENITINGIVEVRNLTIFPASEHTSTFNCNNLENIKGYLNFAFTGTVSFNKLKYINSVEKNYDLYSELRGTYNEINLPELKEFYNLNIEIRCEHIFLPKLESFNICYANNWASFITFKMPNLISCKDFYLTNENGIRFSPYSQIEFPNLQYAENVSLSHLKLDTQTIDNILHTYLNVNPVSGKFLNLSIGNTAPSAQGLIDKQTLINQGNMIYTE